MRDILLRIKYAWQRAVNGYDDRMYEDYEYYVRQFIIKTLQTLLVDGELMAHQRENVLKVYSEFRQSSIENIIQDEYADIVLTDDIREKIHKESTEHRQKAYQMLSDNINDWITKF